VWLQLVGVVCAVLLVPTILSLFWMDDAVPGQRLAGYPHW